MPTDATPIQSRVCRKRKRAWEKPAFYRSIPRGDSIKKVFATGLLFRADFSFATSEIILLRYETPYVSLRKFLRTSSR